MSCYPHDFRRKSGDIVIASVRPSVCPSGYLLLNRRSESNQIWCVSCLHEWLAQEHVCFWPRPQGPWGGVKRSNFGPISSKFNYKVIFKDFYPKLCMFTQYQRMFNILNGIFLFRHLGHALGVGLGSSKGVKNQSFQNMVM